MFFNKKKSSSNKEKFTNALSLYLSQLLSFSICYLKTELVSGDVFGQLSWIRGIELDLEVELPWPLDLLWDSLLRVQPSLIVVVVHITEAKVVLLQEVDAVSYTVDKVLALGFFLLRCGRYYFNACVWLMDKWQFSSSFWELIKLYKIQLIPYCNSGLSICTYSEIAKLHKNLIGLSITYVQ